MTARNALIIVAALLAIAVGASFGAAVPTASAQTISVTSANPPTGEQGTLSLDVVIGGKGFKNGAKAKFYKTGTTDPAGVAVKATRYVSSSQVVATIEIADTAELSKFDIVVALADGRTGKGTELFSVLASKIDPCAVPGLIPSPSAYVSYQPGLPGYLDANFGGGTGRVIEQRAFSIPMRRGAVALQQVAGGRRFLVVGTVPGACTRTRTWTLRRYLDDGSLDMNFGVGGIVTTAFGGDADARGVAIDSLGRIIVVGDAPPRKGADLTAVVVRYDQHGSLDSAFGTGGVAFLPYGRTLPAGSALDVVVQSDDRIIVVGSHGYGNKLRVSRLNSDGTLDKSFNGTGQFDDDRLSAPLAVTIQWVSSEERVVVAGRISVTPGEVHYEAALWRFTPSGAPDPAFGSGGVALGLATEYSTEYHDVVVDGSRLVAVGDLSYYPSNPYLCQLVVTRYSDTGVPDPSVGGGTFILPSTVYTSGFAVAIDSESRILVAGIVGRVPPNPGNGWDVAVWRFTDNAVLDTGFGIEGVAADPITNASWSSWPAAFLLQPDGTMVVVGVVKIGDPAIGDANVPYPFFARFWR